MEREISIFHPRNICWPVLAASDGDQHKPAGSEKEKGRNVDDKSSSSGADWRQPGPNRRRKIDPEANAAAPLDAWSSA